MHQPIVANHTLFVPTMNGVKAFSNLPVGIDEHKITHGPQKIDLNQNYPNPFNAETVIEYRLSGPNHISLKVYNIKGEKIRTLVEKPEGVGHHSVTWDGRDDRGGSLSSGIYVCSIQTGDYKKSIKLMLIK